MHSKAKVEESEDEERGMKLFPVKHWIMNNVLTFRFWPPTLAELKDETGYGTPKWDTVNGA